MKTLISTVSAPAAIGPYSQGVKTNGLLFVSGQIPADPTTGKFAGETIKEQATQSLENVGAILKEAGYSFDDVVKTTCFIADMNDFAVFNEVYAIYFKKDCPARSCVAAKDLPKGALCEVEVIASK